MKPVIARFCVLQYVGKPIEAEEIQGFHANSYCKMAIFSASSNLQIVSRERFSFVVFSIFAEYLKND